jgi:hypothetical protein
MEETTLRIIVSTSTDQIWNPRIGERRDLCPFEVQVVVGSNNFQARE